MFEKHDLSAALERPDASDDDTGGTGRNCDDHQALPGDIVNMEQFAINSHNEVDVAAAEEVTCPYISRLQALMVSLNLNYLAVKVTCSSLTCQCCSGLSQRDCGGLQWAG